MSPRPYSMEKRQAARSETRLRILEAARRLLANESKTDLSMEAVAQGADVSRLTIYYQFSSRGGLLEALFDHLAGRGNMHRMADVFHESDPICCVGEDGTDLRKLLGLGPCRIARRRDGGSRSGDCRASVRATRAALTSPERF